MGKKCFIKCFISMLALAMPAMCGCMAAIPYAMPAIAGLKIGTGALLTSRALGVGGHVADAELAIGGPYGEVFKISQQALKNLGISTTSADINTGIISAATDDKCEVKIQVIKKSPKMTWIKITSHKGLLQNKEDLYVSHLLMKEIKRLAEAAS